MVKKISWTRRAQSDRFEILEYWANRNKSKTYSKKLYRQFADSIKPLAKNPELGIATELPSVRLIVVGKYLIYYKVSENSIEIAAIWDSRRDPEKFKL